MVARFLQQLRRTYGPISDADLRNRGLCPDTLRRWRRGRTLPYTKTLQATIQRVGLHWESIRDGDPGEGAYCLGSLQKQFREAPRAWRTYYYQQIVNQSLRYITQYSPQAYISCLTNDEQPSVISIPAAPNARIKFFYLLHTRPEDVQFELCVQLGKLQPTTLAGGHCDELSLANSGSILRDHLHKCAASKFLHEQARVRNLMISHGSRCSS